MNNPFQRSNFIRCLKSNRQQVNGFFDDQYVLAQLKSCGTMAYFDLMQISFPSKIKISELLKNVEPRHRSMIGEKKCCQILLLGINFQLKDFKIGKTEVHIRPGKINLLDETNEEDKIMNFQKNFLAFMRRIIFIRLRFIVKRE